ncbi:LamG domain-containing protein [Lacipirellula limnantheis]|uniref:FecR protein n=1 Tax=Lacipirellula limnantheis TaxID=2528024 RepID=A0A517TSN3_9BACT|nr:LamG domain-containing protein [Lacipirellula limnantheis]QDT71387.1 hypothetical protein I41_05440 [Lacipirellula limnantheis]
MSIDFPNDELEPLLEHLTLAGLDAAEWQRLRELLASNPAAQRRYLEAIHLREGLGYLTSNGPQAPNDPTGATTASSSSTDIAETAREVDADSSRRASTSRQSSSMSDRAHRSSRHWIPTWAAAAGVAFVAGAAAVALFQQGWAPLMAGRNDQAPSTVDLVTASPAPVLLADTKLGKISGMSLEASSDGLLRSMHVGQELRCGEVVQLSAGFIRIELHAGTSLVIEGPAEFSLMAEQSVFVRSGRLTARGDQPFHVQTPVITAECMNARVSFDAAEDDSASVYVHDGVVTLLTTPQEEAVSEKLKTLHPGQGLRVEPTGRRRHGKLTLTASGPLHGVVQDWSDVEDKLGGYQRLVLGDRPLAYWPLDRVDRNRRVLDLSQNGFDGKPVGNWPAKPHRSSDGEGVYFNGESYIEPDKKPPLNLLTGFTVESWAKVEGGPEFQSIFTSRWVLRSHEPDCQMYGFTLYAGDQDCWEFWSGNGRKGDLWQKLISTTRVDRTEWAHVVATFAPTGRPLPGEVEGIVRIFVNGEEIASGIHQLSLTDFEWPARIGAAEYVPRYLTSWLFRGRLRDIAVYDYPLEANRIREHHDSGKSPTLPRTSSAPVPRQWHVASREGARI